MDISKQTRDESGELVTQYESQGPIPVAHQEVGVEAEEAPQAAAATKEAPVAMKVRPAMRRSAVLVAHGMGQQIRFQTMDDVVGGLSHEDDDHRKHNPGAPKHKPQTSTIEHAGERIQRVELSLLGGRAQEHEVHVFEGYWAPLVEGKVTIRDVIGFFFRTGMNGISNGASRFKRWVFGNYKEYNVRPSTSRHFCVALLFILSLIIMNSTLMGVLLISPWNRMTGWLSGALFEDLTTAFNIALTGILFFALPTAVGMKLHQDRAPQKRRKRVIKLSWIGLGIALTSTIFSGIISVPITLVRHILWVYNHPGGESEAPLWTNRTVDRFNCGLEVALAIAILAIIIFTSYSFLRVISTTEKNREKRAKRRPKKGSSILTILFIWLFILILSWAFSSYLVDWTNREDWRHIARYSVSWVLFLLASVKVRTILVQYVGDVAAYVSPQVLDRFNELRQEIRDAVYRQASGIYECTEHGKFSYDEIFIVGHSLGSVVVYDVLNRLLAQDELIKNAVQQGDKKAEKHYLNVLGRTKLLLTFGSPLDKTAFLFSLQAQDTSETREALAAEVQPLIKDSRFRTFPWVNIWSHQDIFSGELDFYDPPRSRSHPRGPNAVKNLEDKEATTLLLAHVEYWRNPLLFRELYSRV